MTVLYKTLKNSNVSNYVKDRVLNDNLEYLLSNGIQELLDQLTTPLNSEEIIIWGDGSIEISVYSDIYLNHEKYFKKSVHKRESLRGINKSSRYYTENKIIFESIQNKVQDLLKPMNRLIAFDLFGSIKGNENLSSKVKCNAIRLHFINGISYVEVQEEDYIPKGTLQFLKKVEIKEIEELSND